MMILLSVTMMYADKPKIVKISYTNTYRCSNDDSKNEGRLKAIEQAKIDALAHKFGVMMDQQNKYDATVYNDNTQTTFLTSSTSNVRGEWVTEPTITCDLEYDERTECFVFIVTVEGKAREIIRADIDIHTSVLLRPDDTPERECTDINNEQLVYLHFNSPVSGYLIAYIIDENGDAARILPYNNDSNSNVPITGSKDYVFFDKDNPLKGYENSTNDLYFYTNQRKVTNRMLLLFSVNPIHKAHDTNPNFSIKGDYFTPNTLKEKDFYKYLGNLRTSDTSVQVIEKFITISNL